MKAIRRFTVLTVLPSPLEPLGRLALNLRWSWHEPTRELFADVDPERWLALHRDPVRLLGDLSAERLAELAADKQFVAAVRRAAKDLDAYLSKPLWYQQVVGAAGPESIAYFSPEFGVTSALPQYSGGLGILAGDHLKAASDLGVPVTGVGLLYAMGYFKQALSRDGWQTETYPVLDPDGLPLTLLREADGTPAMIRVELPGGRSLAAHVWKADVGRVPLLLLDSDVPDNDEASRAVTDRLYGGGGEHRLQQEILLGVGGVRALRLYSRLTDTPAPAVFHTNEGHAGFLGLERIRELMDEPGLSFEEALAACRANTVFTTHTSVPAGIDRFAAQEVLTMLGSSDVLGDVPIDKVMELGAETYEGGTPGIFNMTVMGLRLAQRANGVSTLHGQVSRGMFAGLWPGFEESEVPITAITNGVHAPSWADDRLLALAPGLAIDDPASWQEFGIVAPDRLWDVRRQLRGELVADVRARVRRAWLERGASPAELGWVDEVLDPDVLTIGFARRVPTYKRLTLMLRDPDRLRALLLDPERPIQLVIAGKSHPADDQGKRLIQQLVQFADDPAVRQRIVFLPNYDIEMAQALYPGCDVWLNNPLRPLEACGTSGMKAALNGCLNLSIRDGWWDEWFDSDYGWAIPTADGVSDHDRRDDLEAAGLYDLLAKRIVPAFYDRDQTGLPAHWLAMVQSTLTGLGPRVLASRMVREYTERLYVPAAAAGAALTADDYAPARQLADWIERVAGQWRRVAVEHVESSGLGDAPQAGEVLHTRAFVTLGDLDPRDVSVQILHGRVDDSDTLIDPQSQPLSFVTSYEEGRHQFAGDLTLRRTGSFGYTVRVLPANPALADPAELGLVVNA